MTAQEQVAKIFQLPLAQKISTPFPIPIPKNRLKSLTL